MALALAVAIVAADQALKAWVLYGLNLPQLESKPLFGPFQLTMVWNKGVSFGFLRADHDLVRWLLAVFSIGVAILLGVWVRKAERPLFATAVGLVMGGAVGNVIDRIRLGAVADFIDVRPLTAGLFPWIFNLADSAISIGICLLLIDMLRQDGRERAAKSAEGPSGDPRGDAA
jgi:signal peptidase II